jgi:hypothetical protein
MLPVDTNQNSFLKVTAVAGAGIVLLIAVSFVFGGSPETAGQLTATALAATVIVGVWAKQTDSEWKWAGYVWRFVVCWILATVAGAACGVFSPMT